MEKKFRKCWTMQIKGPKVEVNQAMEWMNDGNTVFVDVRSKDAVHDSGLVRGAVHAERGMISFCRSGTRLGKA